MLARSSFRISSTLQYCRSISDDSNLALSSQGMLDNLQVIRVTGRLDRWKGNTSLSHIQSIDIISDPLSMYWHLLQCATETLIYERGMPVGALMLHLHI